MLLFEMTAAHLKKRLSSSIKQKIAAKNDAKLNGGLKGNL